MNDWLRNFYCIKMPKILSLFLLLFLSQSLSAQINWGWTGGLSFNIGNKVKRVGLQGGLFLHHDFIQVNIQAATYHHFNGWGPDLSRQEGQLALGILGCWGKAQEDRQNPFIQILSNQTQRPYSVGYAYKWYWDNIHTSQKTGFFAIGIQSFHLISENDAFIGKGTDKFRTGSITFQYYHDHTLFALNNIMWTGDPKYIKTKRVKGTRYPARFGYFDLSQALYGKFSHGVLALQITQHLPYQQNARLSLGVDAEQIRHFVQNQLIHDMPFVPQRWNKAENAHYPMLDTNGNAYLFEEDQRIRPARFYWELGLNGTLFY